LALATLASLAIDLTANSAQLVSEIKRINKTMGSFEKKAKETAFEAKRAFLGFMTVSYTKALTQRIINTAGSFETLQASLETVFGSENLAALQFKRINEFASQTPFTIQDITEASIKMKSLGLDPSIESLESMGNTASALGKPLMQFTEAVADAVTNEFERLKEFGIKSKQEGDNVTFTFRGVETQVEKSAEAIEGYLLNIGKTEFAGAIQKQAETLPGVLSTLGGAVDNLAVKFADESGLANAVKEASKAMTDWINEMANGRKSTLQLEADIIRLENLEGVRGRNRTDTAKKRAAEQIEEIKFQIMLIDAEKDLGKANEALIEINNRLLEIEEKRGDVSTKRRGAQFRTASDEEEELLAQKKQLEESIELLQAEKDNVSGDDASSGGDKIDTKKQKEAEQFENRFASLEESYLTEQEMLEMKLNEELAMTESAYQKGLILDDSYHALKGKIRSKYAKAQLTQMNKEDEDEKKKKLKHQHDLLGATAGFFGVLGKQSKKFAIAEAITNTWLGVSQSLAAYPMPIAAVFAATHLAAGLQAINNITSGGGGGSVASGGAPTAADIPSVDGVDSLAAANDSAPIKTVYINIEGIDDDALLNKNQLRRLIDDINEEAGSNARIVI
jgi:hypothetical protein